MRQITVTQYRKPLLDLELDGKHYIIKEIFGRYTEKILDLQDEMTKAQAENRVKDTYKLSRDIAKVFLCEANQVPEDLFSQLGDSAIEEILAPLFNQGEDLKKTEVIQ